VDALLEGSVLRTGNRVRITAQLIRGETDEHVWAESYDRNLGDILVLLTDVSRAVAGQVETRLQAVEAPSGAGALVAAAPDTSQRVCGRITERPDAVREGARRSLERFPQLGPAAPGPG